MESLPTEGLQNLEKITAKNVPSMVRFPSAKNFPELRIASLTYPYHCCALPKAYGYQKIYKNEAEVGEGMIKIDCKTGEDLPPLNHGFVFESGDLKESENFEESGDFATFPPPKVKEKKDCGDFVPRALTKGNENKVAVNTYLKVLCFLILKNDI